MISSVSALGLFLCGLLIPWQTIAAGTWRALNHTAPGDVSLMLLLSDGTVMAAHNRSGVFGTDIGREWYRLVPDNQGSYINGSWTTLASMHDSRLYYSSAVLRDGRVFVAGGEYGSGGSTAEIYEPLTDSWTQVPVPAGLITTGTASDGLNAGFRDSICKVLPNGNVLVAPVYPVIANGTLIYNPYANSWSSGNACSGSQNEASWVKLPDDSILTVDISSTSSERYIPSSGNWIPDAAVQDSMGNPIALYDSCGELGAALLLPDGRAFFLGGSGRTAFYAPSGTSKQGKWAAGPNIPNGLGASDAGAAMMVNGRILCAVGPICVPDSNGKSQFSAPTSFYEYDPLTNSFSSISGPNGATDNVESYKTTMLCLPDGSVLYAHQGNQLYVYQPDGAPLAAGKPNISEITLNADASFHLVGTLLNGISEGAAYGDDAQMDSNYPLVRLTDANGFIYYARTYNWSSSSVMTGTNPVTTEFALPGFWLPGWYSLVAVANGISSDPFAFYGPVWVDFRYLGLLQFGTYVWPYQTLAQGVNAVDPGGTIAFKGPASSSETMTIKKPMSLTAVGGTVTIGQ